VTSRLKREKSVSFFFSVLLIDRKISCLPLYFVGIKKIINTPMHICLTKITNAREVGNMRCS
jgi:hypothetical protein